MLVLGWISQRDALYSAVIGCFSGSLAVFLSHVKQILNEILRSLKNENVIYVGVLTWFGVNEG